MEDRRETSFPVFTSELLSATKKQSSGIQQAILQETTLLFLDIFFISEFCKKCADKWKLSDKLNIGTIWLAEDKHNVKSYSC